MLCGGGIGRRITAGKLGRMPRYLFNTKELTKLLQMKKGDDRFDCGGHVRCKSLPA